MNNIKKLPIEIKSIWRLNAIMDFLILIAITIAIFIWRIFAPIDMKKGLGVATLILLITAILVLLIELILVTYHWNFWTYYIDERQVELHHGFFFRKQIIMPIARIQNVTLKQGPILRWKNLQKVIIVTAAGSEEITGLKNDEANNLKELIMKLAQEAKNDI
ncbi:PH domain-containing protein [Companilactobacillus nuruki]|uniref:YdbS-like PH domain-containing protein n=1 Tax=Companilactobacillus nuruki TaxID=1993540 RepID=A0A2N7ATL1_9LACO|nr:PH domain-containing protein [Companilactobacillus nuruki]PMD69803.1 hypothetical protein CBP76_07765 [Companilactobacillus nuruki]